MSGPIAVVVAGILIGNRGPVDAMSDQTQRFPFGFWNLIDEILNSVLFLLIGLEVLVLRFDMSFIGLGLSAVPLTLLARFVSVGGVVRRAAVAWAFWTSGHRRFEFELHWSARKDPAPRV